MNISGVGILPAQQYIETGKMPVLPLMPVPHKMPVPRLMPILLGYLCDRESAGEIVQSNFPTPTPISRLPIPDSRLPNLLVINHFVET
ncbi:hypothetical protein [Moorena sp. SIO4G3]|uniref:hypothetical protein n=1 Tax=Moorena sp. SIO4G3 TaxID=2607821 RepID=UPI00142B0479|nr:hypothetical protein [Moorena sp. SIO4G3]NEO81843.1 hypothetical protein [Moorena sp. SIO4G3]